MDALSKLFEDEQKRVITPPADFSYRVMQGLAHQRTETETLWDNILVLTRPVLAATLGCAVMMLGVSMILPPKPTRGPTQIYLESELRPEEELIYVEGDTPPAPVVLTHLISVDGQ